MLTFFATFIVVVIIWTIYSTRKSRSENLHYQFNGMIDSVYYTVKGEPYIFVKKVEYYLSDGSWDFDHDRIQKGDSIVKQKNSLVIKVFKPDGRVIIEGE